MSLRSTVLIALAIALVPAGASATEPTDRPPDQGGFTRAMGIPSLYKNTTGVEFLAYRPADESEFGGLVNIGIMRYIGHPIVGLAALGIEGYAGGHTNTADAGARAYVTVPSLLIGAGVDYGVESKSTDFILKLDIPMRRKGIVGAGSAVTFRWLPGRDQTVSVGLTIPFGDRDMGNTRPQNDYVKMDDRRPGRLEAQDVGGIDSTLATTLDMLRERAHWVARLTQPFADRGGADAAEAMAPDIAALREHMAIKDAFFPAGHTVNEEIRVYHETLDRAFSLAEGGAGGRAGSSTDRGRRISANARRILLDDVVFPYNYLFGQRKKKDTLSGYVATAQTDFARYLLSEEKLTREPAARAFFVFQALCDLMEANRAELRERWGENRYVWLPLQYGLAPSEHDSQEELNRIVERATQREFAAGNRTWYIINEEFQYEMARSVRAANDYHVLWIHDMSGDNHQGKPDEITYGQVKNYLIAMTERVRAYDETGKLPAYFIFLDQLYFESNKSRPWLELLQDPMRHHLDLPKEFDAWEQEIARLQADLRAAVDASWALQIELSQFGEKWLRNRIRVQVNITNPADYSFFSMKVIGKIPIPDNHMRDHRKIIFYDITEDDPYRGLAMFTGMGIGEHYTGATWEDRALMLQGPAALATKDAVRFLLKTQGFNEDETPFPFRERPKPVTYDAAVAAEAASMPDYLPGRVIELHNETGFSPKPLSVAKCVLYSLMPPRTVIKVPDSLWQDYVYASLLAGSALRGCRVLVIAPSLRAAPSSGSPQMARANGLMKRIVVFGNAFDDDMHREGGIFRAGLYAPKQGVGDIAGRMRQAVSLDVPWGNRVDRFDPSVEAVALNAQKYLDDIGYRPSYLAQQDSLESPKLHLKANLFASTEVWDDLMARPEWSGILVEYIKYLARQQGRPGGDASSRDVRAVPEELDRQLRALLQGFFSSVSSEEREHMVAYLTMGSVNMDYRSQCLNGEVMVTVGGVNALMGALDFTLLAGLCEWPTTPEEVDALLPPPGWFMRKISGFVKIAL